MAELLWTKQYDDNWYQMLSVNLYDTHVEVIEWLKSIKNEEIVGRTLTVENPEAFLRSYHVNSDEEFERQMDYKDERGILDLDHIHRHCERHSLKYKMEGLPLGAARRKYREQQKDLQNTKLSIALDMCHEAPKFLFGTDKQPADEKIGLGLLENAALVGIYGAYGMMAQYYLYKNKRGEAIAAARKGIANGDPLSMYIISVLYREGADFENLTNMRTGKPDMEKAVEWCLKAARGGWIRAIRDLNKYIHKGLLVPDTKLYLELLVIQAKLNSISMKIHKAKKEEA